MTDVYAPPPNGFRKVPLHLGDPYTKTLTVAFPTTKGLTSELNDHVRQYITHSQARIKDLVTLSQNLRWERDAARKQLEELQTLVEQARVGTVAANDELHMLLVDESLLGGDPASYMLGEEEKAVEPEGGKLPDSNGLYSPPATSSSGDSEGRDLEGLDDLNKLGESGGPQE